MAEYRLVLGDCLEVMPTLADQSIDCVIADPPYPEIARDYGRMSEQEWFDMMMALCSQTRRTLKPAGSAVFILQPNSRKAGSMRGWLWEFMAWICREWNMVQDVWWWNITSPPSGGATTRSLLRGSIKACVWCGPSDCYREQTEVLWSESEFNIARRASARAQRVYKPSGHSMNEAVMTEAAVRRGGVTPYNLLPFKNNGPLSAGALTGHPAGTPYALADWWVRYICPPGGVVCDPFTGSGTMGLAAIQNGRNFIGIEIDGRYHAIAEKRIRKAQQQAAGEFVTIADSATHEDLPLFAEGEAEEPKTTEAEKRAAYC